MIRIALLTIIVALGGLKLAVAQSLEKYVPAVLIEGKWGDGQGKFGYAMFEGESRFPSSFSVDRNGNVIVLDSYNNRIQIFDKSGKYVSEIPVETFRRASDKEIEESKKKGNTLGLPFPTISIERFWSDTDDIIHIKQKGKISLLNTSGKTLGYSDTSKDREKHEISVNEFNKEKGWKIRNDTIENGPRTLQIINTSNKLAKDIKLESTLKNKWKDILGDKNKNYYETIIKTFIDKNDDIFAIYLTGEVQKISIEGNVLAVMDTRPRVGINDIIPPTLIKKGKGRLHKSDGLFLDCFVDREGIFYQMILMSRNWTDFPSGIRIIRWGLSK